MIERLLKESKKKGAIKRSLSLTLAIIMSCGLLPIGEISTRAEETGFKVEVGGMSPEEFQNKYEEGNMSEPYATGNTGIGIELIPGIVAPPITIDGEIGFCLNLYKNFPVGSEYPTSNPYNDRGITSILYHGYPVDKSGLQAKYELSDSEARYYTQVAIWQYAGDLADRDRGIPYLNELILKAKAGDIGTHNFKISPTSVNASQMNGYQETPTVSTSGARGTFSFPSDNNVWSTDTSGNNKNSFNIGENFKVRGINGYNGEKTMNITSNIENPAALQYNPSNTGNQKIVKFKWGDPIPAKHRLTVKFNGTGNIELIKFNEDRVLLEGVKFGLYSDKECINKIGEATTGADGMLRFSDIVAGTYYLKELATIGGHTLSKEVKDVTVSGGETQRVEFTNEIIKGQIKIIKKDEETGVLLQGAEFEVVNKATGKVVETLTTGVDGTAISSFHRFAEYIVRESKAPDKYTLDGKEYPVTIDTHMKTIEITHSNRIIKGKVKVTKIDEETGVGLQGAEFELINKENGNVVETLVTGIDGTATSNLHNYGDYILKESKAPNKYTLDGQEYEVTIDIDMKVIEIIHTNRIIKGRVEIKKIDKEIKDLLLAGAEFTIYDDASKEVEKVVTDENGYGISKLLNWGNYTMIETKEPVGFLPNPIVYNIEIREDGKVYTYDIENQIIKGKIQIVKLDKNTNKPVKGVKFGVYARNVLGILENTLIEEIITDENGFAYTSDLRFGEYFLKELEAPEDYYVGDLEYPVNITENNKLYVEHISNEPVEGKVRVIKKDGEDKTPLKNVKFKIVNRITNEDVEFTKFIGLIPVKFIEFKTNKNGEFKTPQSLPFGSYSLVEVEPKQGYNPIESIPFEINRDTDFENIELLGKVITLEVENSKIKGNIELFKYDNDTKEPMKNVEFLVECTKGFDKGKTWTLFTGDTGIIKIDNLNYGKYKVKEVKTLEGYVLNTKEILFEIVENAKTIKLEMSNYRIKANMKLLKVDADTKEAMANVKFKITGLESFNKDKVWDLYSNDYGIVELRDLEYGKYRIDEVETIEGYTLNEEPIEFWITDNGLDIKLEMENNRIKSDMKLLKRDADTKEPLSNVLFKITGLTGFNQDKTWELYSNDYGIVELRDLEYGTYRVDEIKTANGGYVLNTKPINFEVKDNGKLIELEMSNRKIKGNMKLLKVEKDTGNPMPNVEFKITCVEGFNLDQEYNLTSNTEGKIKIENLEAGVYRVDEIATLEGFILNTEPILFTIQNDGETIQLEMENQIKKGQVEIIKKDSITTRKLEGVEFTIYDLHRNELDKLVTDNKGYAISNKIDYGQYIMRETKAPKGYKSSDNIYKIEITEEGQIVKFEIENYVKEGTVDFSKIDVSTGENIEGATIEITGKDETNSHIKIEFVSSKEGNIFKLPYGKYEFKETTAPEGYVLSEEIGTFEIKEDGEIVKAELKNKRIEKEELPYTGGMPGSTVILFGILLTASGLVLNKRRTRE